MFMVILLASGSPSAPPEYVYHTPRELKDGWKTASLQQVGMKTEMLELLMCDLMEVQDHFLHSILIIRNNRLVFEEYFSGQDADLSENAFKLGDPKTFGPEDLHFMASASKSITSLLVGIAMDKGYIQDLNQAMFSFFPEYDDLRNRRKNRITLQHLLTMSSGMLVSEDYAYSDPRNELNQMWHAPDPLKFALKKDLIATPGRKFIYNSGNVILLGEIIRRSSGIPLADFAGINLFKPLGIDEFKWIGFDHDPDMAFASTALYLHPRDIAKIGQLLLQNGIWAGDTLVSPEWIRESTRSSILPTEDLITSFHTDGYGFLWWLETYREGTLKAYSARGHGLQFLVVLPDAEMVIVITGGAWKIAPSQAPVKFNDIIGNYILRALE